MSPLVSDSCNATDYLLLLLLCQLSRLCLDFADYSAALISLLSESCCYRSHAGSAAVLIQILLRLDRSYAVSASALFPPLLLTSCHCRAVSVNAEVFFYCSD